MEILVIYNELKQMKADASLSGTILNSDLCVVRDALSDLALHFLNKMKIMVIKEIEREEIEFICKVCCHFMPYALILTCSCWPWVYGVCSVRLCLVRQLVCVLRMMLLHPHRSHGHRTTGIIVLAL